jgi:hypothetical protein
MSWSGPWYNLASLLFRMELGTSLDQVQLPVVAVVFAVRFQTRSLVRFSRVSLCFGTPQDQESVLNLFRLAETLLRSYHSILPF